ALQQAKFAYKTRSVRGKALPYRTLLFPKESAHNLQSPSLFLGFSKFELAQGYFHLCGPTFGVDLRFGVPDRIPTFILIVPVVRLTYICFYARCGNQLAK